ncbi:unnamed protein product [Auanema sp. JU1783]|nr:unnamed protein product [Auanema sp. JU1783]
MSAKKCAREECGKSVYPIEELKCLDKVWHKQCFKCTVCGMTLNMKNYKGYDKRPYCEPHYPKTVASSVADTPEMRRIAENTKIQSQVKYHAEYEKMKGTKIEIADDPEVTRHMKNTAAQSQLAYTGEIEKRKKMEEVRPTEMSATDGSGLGRVTSTPLETPAFNPSTISPSEPPFNSRINEQPSLIYSSDKGPVVNQNPARQVGSIADYDPLNGQWGSVGHNKSKEVAQRRESNGSITSPPNGKQVGFAVKALYDYSAADKDEVSFLEGDIIVNCEKVDEGWMTGTVQRTLQWGMLPANYVQSYKLPTGLHRIK